MLFSDECSTVSLSGDDCISIVSNSSRVTIRNIICGPGHGIRYSSLPSPVDFEFQISSGMLKSINCGLA